MLQQMLREVRISIIINNIVALAILSKLCSHTLCKFADKEVSVRIFIQSCVAYVEEAL